MTGAERRQFERRSQWRELLAAARGFCDRMRAAGVIGERTYGRKITALTVAAWALQHHEDIPNSVKVEMLTDDCPLAEHLEIRIGELLNQR